MRTRLLTRSPHRTLRVIAVGLLLATVGWFAPSDAIAETRALTGQPALDIFVVGGSVVVPDASTTVRVTVRAAEAQPLPEQTVRLLITSEPLDSEAQLRRFLAEETDVPLLVVGSETSAEVLEQETGEVNFTLAAPAIPGPAPVDPEELPAFLPAIYGLQADFLDAGAEPGDDPLVSQRQLLVVLPEGVAVAPTGIAPIVPVIPPAIGGKTLTAEELDNYTAPGGVLSQTLDAVSPYPLTLAVDSRITLSIEALGGSAPPAALAWQAAVDARTAPTIALPWADADPLATIRMDTLLYGRLGDYPWIHQGATVSQLEDVSARSASPLLLPSTVIDSERTVVGWGSTRIIRVDDLMSTLVQQSVQAPSVEEAEAALQRAQGLVAMRALTQTSDPLVFHTGRLPITASVFRLEDIIQRLSTLSLGEIVGVPFDSAASESIRVINETPPTSQWLQFSSQVGQLWEQDVAYVSIADNPEEAILGRWNRYQALFSSTWLENPLGLDAEWERAQIDSQQFRSSVGIDEGSAFTVLSDRTDLPVLVRNDLRSTVRVQLVVTPQRAIVSVDDPRIDVVVPADSVQRVSIPVTALASGTVLLTMVVEDRDGNQISEPVELQVTIRAGWENVITGVLAIAIGIVFAVGIYRAVQRRRQRPEDAVTTAAPDDTA